MKIRYIIFFTGLVMLAGQTVAQQFEYADNNQVKTLLGGQVKVRGFGSVDLKVSQWNKQTTLLVGGHGGVILNNQFTLGLGGYGITTRSKFKSSDNQDNLYLGGGYGGLLIGYSIFAREIFHVHFPILFGGGGIDVLEDEDNIFSNGFDNIKDSTGFFILEPGVEIEINVASFFRLAIGGTYRFIEGSDLNDISQSDLENWSTHISFKFGKF
ncbi:hypothetical protein QQ020_20790 [Fulvivirgaceae bacterium BMA12]|uniref:Outer membrane protein beta-barrel domain-containing protein n=1 Tax=Agaribacillus aureus TaxID=3051825 RepID=A0ABT8L9U7_9BACT|nr:hypothetical protein [Fulvivirgaceae bacterium BMA12]